MFNLNKRGITALEIVGYIILTAVILGLIVPPIQRAVAKQWAAQMEVLINNVVDEQRKFYAANKRFALRFDELNVQIESPSKPPTSEIGLVVPTEDSNKKFPHYEILINTLPPAQFESVTGVLTSGHYRAAGLTYVFRDLKDGHIPLNQLLCFEVDDFRYVAAKGGFCERVMGYKYIHTSAFWVARLYVNPKDALPPKLGQEAEIIKSSPTVTPPPFFNDYTPPTPHPVKKKPAAKPKPKPTVPKTPGNYIIPQK